MLMRRRQEQYLTQGPRYYFLSSDGSMQHGQDFQMSIEDAISVCEASKIFEPGFDSATFTAAEVLKSTTLPPVLVGAGNSSLSGKYETFLESLKLDVGVNNLGQYSRQVISFVADYGTESKFTDVPCRDEDWGWAGPGWVQDLVIRLGLLTNYPPYMGMNIHIYPDITTDTPSHQGETRCEDRYASSFEQGSRLENTVIL